MFPKGLLGIKSDSASGNTFICNYELFLGLIILLNVCFVIAQVAFVNDRFSLKA